MPIFIPNGNRTVEPCPACQNPDQEVEHGQDDKGSFMHYAHCPECGDSMPIVCYDCPHCKEEIVMGEKDIIETIEELQSLLKEGDRLTITPKDARLVYYGELKALGVDVVAVFLAKEE